MPVCLVCKKCDATVSFPRSKDLREEWIKALNIDVTPTDKSRICHEHFRKSDIGIDTAGRMIVRNGCVPSHYGTTFSLYGAVISVPAI